MKIPQFDGSIIDTAKLPDIDAAMHEKTCELAEFSQKFNVPFVSFFLRNGRGFCSSFVADPKTATVFQSCEVVAKMLYFLNIWVNRVTNGEFMIARKIDVRISENEEI